MASIVCLCAGFLFGCSTNNTQNNLMTYVSEYRQNLFIAKTEKFLATYTTGKREIDYIMDGQKTTLTDFGVLTVSFFGNENFKQFCLTVNEDKFEGELELNPYDGTFVFDTQHKTGDNSSIKLFMKDLNQQIELQCVSSFWTVNYHDALNIFADKYKTQLNNNFSKNLLDAEIYIKIVSKT
ncbi:MAG: hypothetical protein IJD48_01130, partial [Clostridia bacterium]|nr:hypothetical protein [Clostridia bacterium]